MVGVVTLNAFESKIVPTVTDESSIENPSPRTVKPSRVTVMSSRRGSDAVKFER